MKRLFGLLFVLCLYGCGDIESPQSVSKYIETVDANGEVSTIESSSSSLRIESSSSSVWWYYSSSSYSSRYSSSSFFSSSSYSSSSSARSAHLSDEKQMELTLTYYLQLKSYEGTSRKIDGDPIIYFNVIAIDYIGYTRTPRKTSKIFNTK